MLSRYLTTLLLLGLAAVAAGQDSQGELTKVKEQELEDVRERISELKKSMDEAAEERDRLAGELQELEVAISEQRMRLKEIERDRQYTAGKKQKLDDELAEREQHLDAESEALAAQVRTAYMSGGQERIKLLLNQQDPATLGRLMTWYGYLNAYRGENINTVSTRIRELAALATRHSMSIDPAAPVWTLSVGQRQQVIINVTTVRWVLPDDDAQALGR